MPSVNHLCNTYFYLFPVSSTVSPSEEVLHRVGTPELDITRTFRLEEVTLSCTEVGFVAILGSISILPLRPLRTPQDHLPYPGGSRSFVSV